MPVAIRVNSPNRSDPDVFREPSLPEATVDTTYALPEGTRHNVSSSAELTAALTNVQRGEVIVLDHTVNYTGNFTLLPKGGDGYYYIVSKAIIDGNFPRAEGERARPSDAGYMPTIITTNSSPGIETHLGEATAGGVRFVGVEVSHEDTSINGNFGLVRFGEGDDTDPADVPSNLILDRCYIHGGALTRTVRCVSLNCNSGAIIDSWIAEAHSDSSGSQAINSIYGGGPFHLENNYISGSTENWMSGGSDQPAAFVGVVPSDWTIRRNHFHKPARWNFNHPDYASDTSTNLATFTVASYDSGTRTITAAEAAPFSGLTATNRRVRFPSAGESRSIDSFPSSKTVVISSGFGVTPVAGDTMSIGIKWSVKNICEVKTAQRVLFEGNIFDGSWVDGQTGYCWLLKSENQDGANPWAVCQDITIRHNYCKNFPWWMNVAGVGSDKYAWRRARRIWIHDNICDNFNAGYYRGSGGRPLQLAGHVHDFAFEHNTLYADPAVVAAPADGVYIYSTGNKSVPTNHPGGRRIRIRSNIIPKGQFGWRGSEGEGSSSMSKDLESLEWERNLLVGGNVSLYPNSANNAAPADWDAVGMTDRTNGDYTLTGASSYKSYGHDGEDPGADVAAVNALISGVAIEEEL